MNWRRRFESALPHLIFFALAMWTIHIFFRYGLVPVDANDEASHTFIENTLFFRALASGHYLLINLFNAFGTPLIGEAVFVPWAPHSLTYAFVSGWQGMMVNKVLTLFFTLEVLFYLGRAWGLTTSFAAWAAILSATNPAFHYLHNHHPHQGALLYFGLVLLCFERFVERSSPGRALALGAAYLALLFGVGINAAANAHLFLAIYFVLSLKRLDLRRWLTAGLAMSASLLVALPHYISFAKWAPLTGRSQTRLFDFENVGHLDFAGLATGMLYLIDQIHLHMDYAIVQTIVLILVTAFAIATTMKDRSIWKGHFVFRLFVAGLVTSIGTFAILGHDEILNSLPFLKSTDPTRLLWFSLLFLHAGVAFALQQNLGRNVRSWWWAAAYSLVVAYFFWSSGLVTDPPGNVMPFLPTDRWIAATSAVAVMVLGLTFIRPIPAKATWIVLVLLILPKLVVFHFVSQLARTNPEHHGVNPPDLPKTMKPYTRMASLFAAGESADQRVALDSIFGSNARSIILSSELRDAFKKNFAVQDSYVTYYFLPSAIDRFDSYGIRYVLSRNQLVSSPGWTTIATLKGLGNVYQVSERKAQVTPIYCVVGDALHYLEAEYVGNQIKIVVSHDCPTMVAAFYRWPGWYAVVNGERRELAEPKALFLTAANLKAGDDLRFVFGPWWTRAWWAFLIAAIACALGARFVARRST